MEDGAIGRRALGKFFPGRAEVVVRVARDVLEEYSVSGTEVVSKRKALETGAEYPTTN